MGARCTCDPAQLLATLPFGLQAVHVHAGLQWLALLQLCTAADAGRRPHCIGGGPLGQFSLALHVFKRELRLHALSRN